MESCFIAGGCFQRLNSINKTMPNLNSLAGMVIVTIMLNNKVLLAKVEAKKDSCNGLYSEDMQSIANNPLSSVELGAMVFKVLQATGFKGVDNKR
jgi:hypothetical protein